MTPNQKRHELIKFRLTQATESLDEARFLFKGGKSFRAVINRLYYSMFYAVLALLVLESFSSSKHSGVLGYFNQRFIRTGVFPEKMGRSLHRAFELRLRGDYRENVLISSQEIESLLEETESFLQSVRNHLGKAI